MGEIQEKILNQYERARAVFSEEQWESLHELFSQFSQKRKGEPLDRELDVRAVDGDTIFFMVILFNGTRVFFDINQTESEGGVLVAKNVTVHLNSLWRDNKGIEFLENRVGWKLSALKKAINDLKFIKVKGDITRG